MTKRKAKPVEYATLPIEPERVGTKVLVVCPICGGYGGIMFDDGDWKTCKACGGGGKTYKEDAPCTA